MQNDLFPADIKLSRSGTLPTQVIRPVTQKAHQVFAIPAFAEIHGKDR